MSYEMSGTRLKGLDGIRAFCALLILWGHMAQKDFVGWELNSFPLPECTAYVFFVLSGFLAGFRIDMISSLEDYYLKKAIRILPLYYVYIMIVSIVFLIKGRGGEVLNIGLLYYLFLVPGIPFAGANGILPLVHLWFIGTLILFYLVFPLFARLKDDNRGTCAAVIAFIWLIIKLSLKVYFGGGYYYRLVSITCFDILFLGVWGGLTTRDRVSFFGHNVFLPGLVAWGLFLLSGLYGRFVPAPIRAEYISILSLIMIVSLPKSISFLENKVTRFLGRISYEMYVSHILVIILLSELYCQMGWQWRGWILYPVVTVVAIVCAFALKVLLKCLPFK